MSDSIFQREVKWQHERAGSGVTRSPNRNLTTLFVISVGITAGVALLIRLLIGHVSGALPPPPTPLSLATVAPAATATLQPTATLPAPTPTPNSCTAGVVYLRPILLLEARSQWEQAASTAAVALQDETLCSDDKQALAAKSVSDGLEAIFAQPLPPYTDVAAQQHQVDLYYTLKRQAEAAGISFPMSTIQAAARAYGTGQFLLCKTLFEEAWRAGDFTAADQSLIQQYYASLYNLGLHWAEEGSGKTQQEGLQLLVTADQIDSTYHLGARTAWGALHQLVGEERSWPKPSATPLLQQI